MIGFGGVVKNVYGGVELITIQEVKRSGNALRNGKGAGIDEITGKIIKNCGECVKE